MLLGGKETIPVVQISPRVARRPDKRRTSTPFWSYVHCLTCKAKSVEIFVAFLLLVLIGQISFNRMSVFIGQKKRKESLLNHS